MTMARYRKAEVALWFDERFLALSAPQPNAQTLWLYLLTGPRTTILPGLVLAHEEVMASDLRWPLEAFRKAFGEVFREGMAKAFWPTGVVVLPRALFDSMGTPRATSKPQSPNVVKGWATSWELVPDCELTREYLVTLKAFAEAFGEAYAEAFAKAFQKAFAKGWLKPSGKTSRDQESGDRKQETGESRARAIPRSTEPPPVPSAPPPAGSLSPDPRIRINHDAWAYAALKHAELRREGIDPGAVPWPPMPAGIAKDDLVARTKELTPNTPLDGSDIERAASTHVRRVDVAVAEARREKHLRWFTPSRFYTAESFWRAAELTPEQAAQRYANRTNTSNGATGEPRIVLPAVDDDIPMNNPYESITSKL